RYGKTSLVRKLFDEAGKQGTVGILVDMKGVLTLADIVTRVGRGFGALQGPVAKALRPSLEGIEAQFNVSVAGTGGGGGVRRRGRPANEEGALFALLDLPVKFTGKGWKQVIVCFDEFQDVLAVEAADDKLRSAIQHQPDTISYVFAGSEPRLMNQLFAQRRRAFWSQAEPLALEPLDATDCAEYIAARFTETGMDVGDALGPLLRTAQGHPQRTMLLASKLWSRTETAGGEATLETWQQALVAAKLQVEPECEAQWRGASTREQRVLRAVCLNDGRPYRKAATEAVGIPSGSVETAAAALVEQTVLRRVETGRFTFIDPLYELYVHDLAESALPAEDGERD
ncbi:MAG TPA: hypothetical protein VFJ24_01415, partial [Gaiellales bacterium]|nr:hypothetical protein [Gaiellales bacterium]